MRELVIQTEHLSPAAAQWLAERCELVVCGHDEPGLGKLLARAAGLVVRTYTIVNQAMLDAAPHLRVVGRAGVGLDNVDQQACAARGIKVVYTPDANTQAVVEYVVCLLCDALRPRVQIHHALEPQAWNELRAKTVGERQMDQLTLGILGLGRVGGRLARVASAIGMRVIYNDLRTIDPDSRHGATPVAVDQLFSTADIVSIHIDGRKENRGFVSQSLIGRMRDDAIFVNTSRGLVVDNLSLARFFAEHPKARAYLDVHDPEPFTPEYPLLGLTNVHLYPHLASRTEQAMENMSWVVRDVYEVLSHPKP